MVVFSLNTLQGLEGVSEEASEEKIGPGSGNVTDLDLGPVGIKVREESGDKILSGWFGVDFNGVVEAVGNVVI